MLIYDLVLDNCLLLQWHYWPEGNQEKKPGLIEINKANRTVSIRDPAEDDFKTDLNGWYYATYAKNSIEDFYNNGVVIGKETIAWS